MNESQIIELRNPLEELDQLHNSQQTLAQLLSRNEFVDCTICCKDGQVQAHRIILAAASKYMHNMLLTTPWPTPCSHPVLFFKSSSTEDMKVALAFIYTGKAFVCRKKLPNIMNIARDLECTYLVKAIEKAIQSCGIELFRQRVLQTHANNSNIQVKLVEENRDIENSEEQEKPTDHDHHQQGSISVMAPSSTDSDIDLPVSPTFIKTEGGGDDECLIEDADVEPTAMVEATLTSMSGSRTIVGRSRNSNDGSQKLQSPSFPFLVKERGNGQASSHDKFQVDHSLDTENSDELSTKSNEGEQHQVDDDEEMAISVVDLKSLAEPHLMKSAEEFVDPAIYSSADGQPANCPWCLQVFTSASLLQKHIRTHVGTYKPFACPYCSASFARSAHLKRHIRTHTGEKPFICTFCDKAFSRQDKLKTHLERHLQNQQGQGNNSPLTSMSNSQIAIAQNPGFIKSNSPVVGSSRKGNNLTPLFSTRTLSNNSTESRLMMPNSIEGAIAPTYFSDNNAEFTWPDQREGSVALDHSHHDQILISTSSISPSTTITPVTASNILAFPN